MHLKMPRKAMVLAAGLGQRLRPYTDTIPKPLLPVAGKPLIDWTLDHLEHAGIGDVVINSFYRADKLQEHVTHRLYPQVKMIMEEELLGTGGAIQNALPNFEGESFFVLHSNIIWINQGRPAFTRLADYWEDDKMDVLALVIDKTQLPWYKGKGDYLVLDTDYQLKRVAPGQDSPILSAGIFLIHPRAFANMPDGAFPLTQVLDDAHSRGRFYGLLHQGEWFGISTGQDYQTVNHMLSH